MAKKRKRTNVSNQPNSRKKTSQVENANSFYRKIPVWRFYRNDRYHDTWSIRNCCNFNEDVMDKLHDFEGQTWNDIINTNGVDTNHYVETHKLIKKAQERLQDLNIFEDQLFSLRLNGKTRLYGVLENGVFNILWFDSEHEIYPSKKKHTW